MRTNELEQQRVAVDTTLGSKVPGVVITGPQVAHQDALVTPMIGTKVGVSEVGKTAATGGTTGQEVGGVLTERLRPDMTAKPKAGSTQEDA